MNLFLGVLVGLVAVYSVSGIPALPLDKQNTWALLVAGSNGYYNYRHQADVCHAYHVLLNEGFKPNKIVTMMYDDIAHNPLNPTPGVIRNKPNGTNVYAGVKIDYRGKAVTPKNFLSILEGDKKAMKGIGTGRVIESDHTANIFVFFSDHGAPGLLAFPDKDLMANDMKAVIEDMHTKKKYNKMIMYIEACEAGSMFDNILKEDINVFAMTASARDESSFAVYCNDTCLGDEFSVNWMEEMDAEPKGKIETFFHQYQSLRTKVLKSHVNIYGDLKMGGNGIIAQKVKPGPKNPSSSRNTQQFGKYVNSRDAALHYFEQRAKNHKGSNSQIQANSDLQNLINGRQSIDALFNELVAEITHQAPELETVINEQRLPLNEHVFPCYTQLIQSFKAHCFGHSHEYILQHYYKLANMCLTDLNTKDLIKKMPKLCSSYKKMVKSNVL